jgi:chromosome segregation ATPase
MGKKSRKKYSNKYNLPDHIASEILKLNNKEIISRASTEYASWMASEDTKKADTALKAVRTQIRELNAEVNEAEEVKELEGKLKDLKESLYSEKLETYKEEAKNLLQPYKEDITFFKSSFRLTMDEINRRKHAGLLTVDGKIV